MVSSSTLGTGDGNKDPKVDASVSIADGESCRPPGSSSVDARSVSQRSRLEASLDPWSCFVNLGHAPDSDEVHDLIRSEPRERNLVNNEDNA